MTTQTMEGFRRVFTPAVEDLFYRVVDTALGDESGYETRQSLAWLLASLLSSRASGVWDSCRSMSSSSFLCFANGHSNLHHQMTIENARTNT